MGIKREAFLTQLADFESVCLDTALFIYHLDNIEPYYLLTTEIFDAFVDGNLQGVLSTVSVAEFVVKPFQENRIEEITNFEQLIFALSIDVVDSTFQIAKQAGKLRAEYGIKIPDALIFCTALENGCDAFITNDKNFRKLEAEGIAVVVLLDFVED